VPLQRLGPDEDLASLAAKLRGAGEELGVAIGISQARTDIAEDRQSFQEAEDAARIVRALTPGGGAQTYAALGPYRYLAALAESDAPESSYSRAIAVLEEYDARRGAELLSTLERYLADRGISRSSRALMVHPNTLRQRLQRIEELAGISLEHEDLLSLELALKVHRLRREPATGAR
jgi:DNA-binding PucR family transcriptional regulator